MAQAKQGKAITTPALDYTERRPMKMFVFKLQPDPVPLVPGSPERDWMEQTSNRHAYRCLPLSMANTSGWDMLCPCGVTIEWNGGPRREDLIVTVDDPRQAEFAKSHFAQGIVTMHSGYMFRTEPGWGILVGGVPNYIKDGIQALSGLIETDWLPYPFTINWKMTRPGKVRFEKGEPFAFITVLPHQRMEDLLPVVRNLDDEPELKAQHESFRVSREEFRLRQEAGEPEAIRQAWQKHYFVGRVPDHPDVCPVHTNKRRLSELLEVDPIPELPSTATTQPVARTVAKMLDMAESMPEANPLAQFLAPSSFVSAVLGGGGTQQSAFSIEKLIELQESLNAAPGAKVSPEAEGCPMSKAAGQIAQDAPTSLAKPAIGHNSDPYADYRYLEAMEPGLPIYYEPDFLEPEKCAEIVAAFQRNRDKTIKIPGGHANSVWNDRFLMINTLPPEERAAKRIMQNARAAIIQRQHAHFGIRGPLYNDTLQIVHWGPGMSMPVHSDNSDLHGSPNEVPHREFSAVTYLNDDYEGGDLVIPPLKLRIRPKPGLLICFRGGLEHCHGVLEVKSGTRYTMPGWYTRDIAKADPSYFELY